MFVFLHVPVTGRIFPATARKPVGPLPMHSASAGDEDLARRGNLQRRGTTFPGILAQNGRTRAALIRVGFFGIEGGSPSEVS